METFKLILHTNGDDKCLRNVVHYPIGKDQVLKEGYGIDPNNSHNACIQFKAVADFYGNQDKTPIFHYMTSYTEETAPTPEIAMELTKEIFKPLTDTHLTGIGIHEKLRGECKYHGHTAMSPTDVKTGAMLYADNTTNYALAQRMADVTGKPTQLVIRKEDGTEWTCKQKFVPRDDEDDDE